MLMMVTELQQEQPQLYESLTSNLSPDEKTVVQSVVHQADAIARRTAAEAEAAQANGGA
jgi:importin-7